MTDSDILALERRLLQTMDMIVSKKKRSDHLFRQIGYCSIGTPQQAAAH